MPFLPPEARTSLDQLRNSRAWNSRRCCTPKIAPPESGGGRPDELIRWVAIVGIALTTINMFGGFAVTRRMLAMFRK